MDQNYQELRRQADRLWHRCNDCVDDKNAARSLLDETRNVVEDFEMNKKPRSIDDRIKRVIQELEELKRGGSEVMDFGDIDELRDGYEELREDLRKLPNY